MVTPKYLQLSDFSTMVEPAVTVSKSLRPIILFILLYLRNRAKTDGIDTQIIKPNDLSEQ